MTIRPSLLPPNSTGLERALEQGMARIGDVPTANDLWNPYACPLELLPWLAWAVSVDRWEADWSEGQKRDAVASAFAMQRRKGSAQSVDQVLASFDELLKLTEWFEMTPRGVPHTFNVDLPLVTDSGQTGGDRVTAAFAEAIVRDVARTKPLRSHWRLRQILAGAATIDVLAAARITGFRRSDFVADTVIEPEWATYLQDHNGEPLQDENGEFLVIDEPSLYLIDDDFSTGADDWVSYGGAGSVTLPAGSLRCTDTGAYDGVGKAMALEAGGDFRLTIDLPAGTSSYVHIGIGYGFGDASHGAGSVFGGYPVTGMDVTFSAPANFVVWVRMLDGVPGRFFELDNVKLERIG